MDTLKKSESEKYIRCNSLFAIFSKKQYQLNSFNNNILDKLKVKNSFTNKNIRIYNNIIFWSNRKHNNFSKQDNFTLIIGDDKELKENREDKVCSNAVIAIVRKENVLLELYNSITGLPPIFIYQNKDLIIVTSSLYLLKYLKHLELKINIAALCDIVKHGHTIEQRTLFNNLIILPAGNNLIVDENGNCQIKKYYQFKKIDSEKKISWKYYIDAQISLFRDALNKMDLKNCILSLTAGLDTRTILAELIRTKKLIPAYTVSGENFTNDAIIARRLCDKYTLKHEIIELGHIFLKNIDQFTVDACLMTGGVSSIEDASKVYFYKYYHEYIDNQFESVLSGYLGNQVGRFGRESISQKNININIFHKDIVQSIYLNIDKKNFIESNKCDFDYLIQKENFYAMANSYTIGDIFANQLTPYANRESIELAYKMYYNLFNNGLSKDEFRKRDLYHRILGDSQKISFQRTLINQVGGYVSECGINWGWKPSGGIAFKESYLGFLTIIDAFLGTKNIKSKKIKKLLNDFNIQGLHHYKNTRLWLKKYLKDFYYDQYNSEKVRNSGLFDRQYTSKIIDDYFNNKNNFDAEIITILNFALSIDNFKATL